MKVKSESEVAQSCPTLHDPMDYTFEYPSQPHNAAGTLDDLGPQEASGSALSGLTQVSDFTQGAGS